ncbi:MAG: hypothetical protein WKG32_24020, partial [Gemmatimonadaceae bacterium]
GSADVTAAPSAARRGVSADDESGARSEPHEPASAAMPYAPFASARGTLVSGALALAAAFPVAMVIETLNSRLASTPERAVMASSVLRAALAVAVVAGYGVTRRVAATPARLALVTILATVVLLAGTDLYWLAGHVRFPADILIWSESDFVADILKLRSGYPFYTAQANNESFIYTPASQVLTWLLASAVGKGDSIVAFRAVQVGFTVLAAAVAALSCRRLLLLAGRDAPGAGMWTALWMPAFFLIATNAVTNPFVQNLHNDALTQLVAIACFWLLLEYSATRSPRILALMAIAPAAGFLVKQSLAVWAPLFCVHLLLFDRPRSLPRVMGFALAAFGGIALAFGACYLAWGHDFIYWTVTVLGAHPHSLLRSVQHVLDVWVYFAVGVAGALVLLRGERARALIGPWLIGLAILGIEAYTSGVAWMLNHMGPGSLIAGVWLMAAVTALWRERLDPAGTGSTSPTTPAGATVDRVLDRVLERWLRPALAAGAALLLLGGLGTVRVPAPPFSADAYRYAREIERAMPDSAGDRVLLDAGSWLYLRRGVVMKDRVTSFGDRGYGEVGDFSAMARRLGERRYDRILVRNLHSPDFWYDHYLWRAPSGIRAALMANYHETGTIRAVTDGDPTHRPPYLFSEISILEPNAR